MKARRDLVFVSAGLGLDGGGRAMAGRLLAGGCAGFARGRGMGFRLLTLDDTGLPDGDAPARGFAGNQRALALEVWKRQLSDRESAYVFDLLGPARTQSYLPAPLRAPYLIPLYGIEVWRPLQWDRRRALAHATVVFSISAHTLERARPFAPGLAGTPVLPLALEERKPEGAVDALLLGRLGRGFFLIVGRMDARERYKGHDQLLEALRGIPDARLVVAGDGDDRRRLEAKAAGLEMADRVAFTGFTSEATLAELYRRCVAFAMPSRGRGSGSSTWRRCGPASRCSPPAAAPPRRSWWKGRPASWSIRTTARSSGTRSPGCSITPARPAGWERRGSIAGAGSSGSNGSGRGWSPCWRDW